MNTVALSIAFLMGLTGSLHCAGMCGPITLVIPFQMLQGYKKWLGIALYHFGRITVYALLGVLIHSFKSIFNPQVQQYISIVSGALLLLLGLLYFFPQSKLQIALPWTKWVRDNLGKLMSKPGLASLLGMGMLNGLLPCGLVYMALSTTVTASSLTGAILLMYAFGLGTTPMLVTIALVKNKAKILSMQHIRRFVPAVMLFFGCLFIVRGMNLGIPYLSPKITVEHNEIKAQCCHK